MEGKEDEKKVDLKTAAYIAFALRKQNATKKPAMNAGKLKVCAVVC